MRPIILVSLVLSSFGPAAQPSKSPGGQVSVDQVLSLLQSPDPNRKGEALVAVNERPDFRGDLRLRQAVLGELRKARADYTKRHEAGGAGADHRSGELLLALIRTAAKFDGPEVVAELLPHLGQSAIAQRRVAASGTGAVDDLVRLYESGAGVDEPELVRFGALKTLADITVHNSISPEQRSSLERIAAGAIKSQDTFVYAGGLYLGAATHRPELIDAAVKAQAGQFESRRLSASDERFLKGVGQRALAQAGVVVR